MFPISRQQNSGCSSEEFRGLLIGENVRDWSAKVDLSVWYPYTEFAAESSMISQLWTWRTTLYERATFNGLFQGVGCLGMNINNTASAYFTPLSITFAFVATHNHFVLDRGGKVFNRSAPVIKLPADATEDDHLALLGLLNSSTACFWMKQVLSDKGNGGIGGGISDERDIDLNTTEPN